MASASLPSGLVPCSILSLFVIKIHAVGNKLEWEGRKGRNETGGASTCMGGFLALETGGEVERWD